MSGWIQTFTGRRFSINNPGPEDFDIRDIAHALSLVCRFNGHCKTFYSVADHSIRVAEQCSPETARWGLLHDLAEAYIGDLPRPIKQTMPAFEEIEDRLLRIATDAFDLSWPMPRAVKEADDRLLATELRDLMVPGPGARAFPIDPLVEVIVPRSSSAAEELFLSRFRALA